MNRNLIIGLDCLLGRRLVRAEQLVSKNSDAHAPLEMGLVFEDDFFATFQRGSEGAIVFLGDSISPLLMGDYGDYIVEDILRDSVFSESIGKELTAAFLIDSKVQSSFVGVKFVFGNTGFSILNVAEDQESAPTLKAFSKIPQAVRIEGKYQLVPLR